MLHAKNYVARVEEYRSLLIRELLLTILTFVILQRTFSSENIAELQTWPLVFVYLRL